MKKLLLIITSFAVSCASASNIGEVMQQWKIGFNSWKSNTQNNNADIEESILKLKEFAQAARPDKQQIQTLQHDIIELKKTSLKLIDDLCYNILRLTQEVQQAGSARLFSRVDVSNSRDLFAKIQHEFLTTVRPELDKHADNSKLGHEYAQARERYTHCKGCVEGVLFHTQAYMQQH